MKEDVKRAFHQYQESAKDFFRLYGGRILVFCCALVSLALSFEGGFLLGSEKRMEPLVIEKPVSISCPAQAVAESSSQQQAIAPVSLTSASSEKPLVTVTTPSADNSGACVFVGSKNSDKYHLPKCSWAKRIKPENRVCFTSAEDAERKGYKPGCVK